jgi:hypothetical protein
MPRIRGSLALALALVLAAPAAAHALAPVDVVPPPAAAARVGDHVLRALELGERRFGPACPAAIRVTWAPFEVRYAGVAHARAWARTFRPECRVELNREVWDDPGWREAVYAWPWLCTLVVHEYGHLAGHGHAADPGDVMHTTIERVAPECAAPPRA